MKLNRKGYMLVEIIVASVLAMTICYYLLNLTYKFKNTNEDIYQSYLYTNDKILITKNIMSDLENCLITSIISSPNTIEFVTYKTNNNNNSEQKRKLIITKENNNTIIKYGKIDKSGVFDIEDVSYYEKEIEPTLIVKDINFTRNNSSITITIPITSIYDDNDYSIKLFAKTNLPLEN